jgi:sirohydrochlorin ferrochelatase
LLGVAHGRRDPAAPAAADALVVQVQRLRPDLVVTCCFLEHAQPGLPAAITAVGTGAVVVPLLLTAAFHSATDLPAQLAAADPAAVQADVLGPHPLLLAGLERRLAEVGVPAGDPDTAVVLAAAGSADPGAQQSVRELAATWTDRGWWAVEAAFASAAAPSVEEAVAALRSRGAPRVAVASYLLAPGQFADRLGAAGADVTSAPLGDAPEVAELVLARYDAVAGR